ncbi:MAG: LD-carboxypeptidase [Desulfobia sp.]
MPETADFSLIVPPLLKEGDILGIIAPSGPWKKDEFQQGVSILENHGFRVRLPDHLPTGKGYLAGSARQRLRTIEQIWKDPEIKAVIPVRGGYGCLPILDFLDYQFIRANPKLLVGFSDVSGLLQAIYKYSNLLTLHGPMLTTLNKCDKGSLAYFFDRLTGRATLRLSPQGLKVLKPGNGSGIMTGGNLTTLTHLMETSYEVSWRNKIVFLEDVGESPYRIDRLFTHLYMAGRFKDVAGLILGEFCNCGNEKEIYDRVLELFQQENFPVWAGFPVGHGKKNLTLPVGVGVEMNCAEGELVIKL